MIIVWLICVMLGSFFLGMLVEGLCQAAAKPAPKPVKAVIGQWHDYISMNQYGYILDPTPEESDRMLRESRIELAEGRPTMPSEVEPELEMERRTR
jgi:hypothetical protein